MAARAPFCLLQVRGFLIKTARFSSKTQGRQQLLESTGGASQPAGTIAFKDWSKHLKEECIQLKII